MTLRTLNYGNYGIFLIMGHAGFCPSTVVWHFGIQEDLRWRIHATKTPFGCVKDQKAPLYETVPSPHTLITDQLQTPEARNPKNL